MRRCAFSRRTRIGVRLVPTITDALGNPANSLNVYLADLRENRKLRSNERERTVVGQRRIRNAAGAPRRLSLPHQRLESGRGVDRDRSDARRACAARRSGARARRSTTSSTRSRSMRASNPPGRRRPAIADERFPITLLPVEGFPKIAEFWGTMGDKNRWKPFLYAVITVALARSAAARRARSSRPRSRDTLQRDVPASANTRYHIGGTVLDNAIPPQPVALAWVELLTAANERRAFTRADALGRFVFADVSARRLAVARQRDTVRRQRAARHLRAGADRQLRRALSERSPDSTKEKTMAVQVSYPGVYIEEFAPGAPIQGVGTSTAAFIGIAASGPLNEPTKVTSLGRSSARRSARCPCPGCYLWYAVRGFFENGGQVCYVVRASNGSYQRMTLNDRTTAPGRPVVDLRARQPGALGIARRRVADAPLLSSVAVYRPPATLAAAAQPARWK